MSVWMTAVFGRPEIERRSFKIFRNQPTVLQRMDFRRYTGSMDRTDTLALFVKAVDVGSLSGAARSLGLSLPSVSRHITALEERLDTRLLIRTTRKLALTDAGRMFYARAKQILADLDDVESSLLADASV